MARLRKYTDFQPHEINSYDIGFVRREYSRLRSIANKRLARIGNTEFRVTDTYQYNKGRFVPLSEITSNAELRAKAVQVSRFLNSDTGSLSGLQKLRDQQIEILRKHGYDFVTRENYFEFVEYMEAGKDLLSSRIYDSERIAKSFQGWTHRSTDVEQDLGEWTKTNLTKIYERQARQGMMENGVIPPN